MLPLRFTVLVATLLAPSLAFAQPSGFGSLGLGGGVLVPATDPGIFADEGAEPLPSAGGFIRVIESPVLLGFYLDAQIVSLSSVRDDVRAEEDLGETDFAMSVGVTLPIPLGDASALYALGGGRLAGAAYSGGEAGGGFWLGLGESIALHAEGGYFFITDDVIGGEAAEIDGAYFVRGGLGIQIQG